MSIKNGQKFMLKGRTLVAIFEYDANQPNLIHFATPETIETGGVPEFRKVGSYIVSNTPVAGASLDAYHVGELVSAQ